MALWHRAQRVQLVKASPFAAPTPDDLFSRFQPQKQIRLAFSFKNFGLSEKAFQLCCVLFSFTHLKQIRPSRFLLHFVSRRSVACLFHFALLG